VFTIFDSSRALELAEWLEMWSNWPAREVFANPYYVRLYARGRSRALCAAWRSSSTCVLYPFVLRDLAEEPFWANGSFPAFDITSAYGYAGAYAWGSGDRQAVARDFWPEFDRWALQQGVVSEFVRVALFPDSLLPYPGETRHTADHIIRALPSDPSVLWMDFEHKVRKNVKKALRCGVRIELDARGETLEEFLRIYQHTMDRRHATADYYFPQEFFESLHRFLRGHFLYFHAMLNGQVVSSELVLVSERNIYSFLGGTDECFYDCRPNDLLKFEVMHWAAGQGRQSLVLGGGYRTNDGIYDYKRAFAPRGVVPYYLGARIFREHIYENLVSRRRFFARSQGQQWSAMPGYFPAYRS
jgi:hypothetical protein